jgi:hypothetical protein
MNISYRVTIFVSILILSISFTTQAKDENLKDTFAGVWDTSFGRMRLIQYGKNNISGVYEYGLNSTISGALKGNVFSFEYKEKNISGVGQFTLASDGMSFNGEWRESNSKEWKKWTGKRILPIPYRHWLLIAEARWEQRVEEREYSFGDMVKAFMDRTPNVEVRRRQFTDKESLQRWLAELAYIPEPVIVSIASHGKVDGVVVDNKPIDAAAIVDSLKYVSNLVALHFSSCLVMKSSYGKEIFNGLMNNGNRTTVSGYKNSVDWAVSALFEMNYFDLVLSRNLSPSEAARASLKMFPLAGDNKLDGVSIPPGGFEFLN